MESEHGAEKLKKKGMSEKQEGERDCGTLEHVGTNKIKFIKRRRFF